MNESKTVPPVTIYTWPKLAVPRTEIQYVLTFLAYKTNKPVTFRWYTEDEGYSENSISVRVAVTDGIRGTSKTDTVRLGEKAYVLSESQATVDIEVNVPEEKQILDDDFLTLAYVDHNRIVVPIELTATDNEAARSLLAYVIEHSIELLDFKMNEKLLEQRKKLAECFCVAFAKGVQDRVSENEENLRNSERDAQSAYYTILDYERRRPVIEKELKYLRRLQQVRKPRLFQSQAQALIELLASISFGKIPDQHRLKGQFKDRST